MSQKKITTLFFIIGFSLVIGSAAFLMTTPAKAQCGSQASSCKSCHETQGQDSVNSDGTAWHTEHAFGDFCYLCHGGNNQATEKTAAHTGMIDPLSDIVTNCKSCHPTDYTEKAQIYATTLGVTLGSGGSAGTTTPSAAATAVPSIEATPVPQSAPSGLVGTNTDVVDYVQRYGQIVLHKNPINVGNIILLVMAAGLLFGGGYFVLSREGWLKISFAETREIKDGYPVDVVDLVPEIARLKPEARKSLHRLLEKPGSANDFLNSVSKLMENPAQGKNEPPANENGEDKS